MKAKYKTESNGAAVHQRDEFATIINRCNLDLSRAKTVYIFDNLIL